MKKTLKYALVALTATTLVASAENISLVDPSFEGTTFPGTIGVTNSGWFNFGNAQIKDITDGSYWGRTGGIANADGPRAAFAAHASETSGASIFQSVELDAGVTYRLKVGVSQPGTFLKDDGIYELAFFNADNSTRMAGRTGIAPLQGQEFIDDFIDFTPTNSAIYNIGVLNRGYVPESSTNEGSTIFFDNTRLTVLTDPVPVILSFAADPSSVISNETFTLSWNTDYEDTLTLNPGSINVTGMSSTNFQLVADTEYELIASNAFGQDTNTVLVSVVIAPPVINEFIATPDAVLFGGTSTLSWDVDFETSLSIVGLGDVTGATETNVVINADTIYKLIAGNSSGYVTSSVPVTVITTPPIINSFTASPPSFYAAGDTITLSWDVEDANALSIAGVGDVTGVTSTQVFVSAETPYTLTAGNDNGTTNASVLITETTNPLIDPSFEIVGFAGDLGATRSGWFAAGSGVVKKGENISPTSTFWGNSTGIDNRDGPNAAMAASSAENDGASIYQAVELTAGITYRLTAGVATSDRLASKDSGKYELVFFDAAQSNKLAGTAGVIDRMGHVFIDDYVEFTPTTTAIYHVGVRNRGYVPGTGGANASTIFFDHARLTLSGTPTEPIGYITIAGPVAVAGGEGMTLSWDNTTSEQLYDVQYKNNLITDPDWTTLTTVTGTGGSITVTNTIGAEEETFYRVISQ